MSEMFSLQKDKIRVLLLEGVNDSAVELIRGAGYTNLTYLKTALDEDQLIEALQGTEAFAVPAALLGPGEHYALEVSGDSMVEEGILDGDFALIRKVDSARDGEIVVALIDNAAVTLGR